VIANVFRPKTGVGSLLPDDDSFGAMTCLADIPSEIGISYSHILLVSTIDVGFIQLYKFAGKE
jgi:hypothetical protein